MALSGQPLKISFKIRSGPLDFPVFKDFIIFLTSEIVNGLSVVSFIEYLSSLDKKSHISLHVADQYFLSNLLEFGNVSLNHWIKFCINFIVTTIFINFSQ
jgi:hypothetical protein